MVDWAEHARREDARYRDGEARLPDAEDQDSRQRQLTRMGNAAAGAGLARLMGGDTAAAREWFARAVERYRESYELAPPGSWGRPIAILKARILVGDWDGAERDARWTLDEGAADAESPIGRYAATLALLVLGRDDEARVLANELRTRDDFPAAVADALAVHRGRRPARIHRGGRGRARILRDARGLPRGSPRRGHGGRAASARARRDIAAELSSPLLP